MLVAALAVAIALPAQDIRSVAPSFAPAGARITIALEHDASFGVVGWTVHGRAGAVALEWRSGGWHRASPGALRIVISRRAGARIRQPALIRVTSRGLAGTWIDGRPVATVDGSYLLVRHLKPGVHVFTALAIEGRHAVARAWVYRLL